MLQADRVVLADTFPFSRQGYQNRMRIRTAQDPGWIWLTVPRLGGHVGEPILTVPIDEAQPWARAHRRAVHLSYSMTPYYEHYRAGVDALLTQTWPHLGALTAATTRWALDILGGTAEVDCASDLPGAPDSLSRVWEAAEAQALGTLPESAESDATQLVPLGASVRVMQFEEAARRQNFPGFVGGTSVLDLIFNYGPDAGAMLAEGITGWRDVIVPNGM